MLKKRGESINNTFEKMNDRDLVVYIKSNKGTRYEHDRALTALWKRYQNQIHNNWHLLARTLHSSDLISNLKDDFYEEAQEVFMVALSKVDPVKINANEKWKFVGYFDFYLRNLRTKFHKDLMKRSNIKSIDSMQKIDEECNLEIDLDVETAYRDQGGYMDEPDYVVERLEGEENCERAIKECLEKWTPTQRDIYQRLLKKEKKQDISRELGLSIPKLYLECNKMKHDLKSCLGLLN